MDLLALIVGFYTRDTSKCELRR